MDIVVVALVIGLVLVIFAPMALLPAIAGSDAAAHAGVRLGSLEPPRGGVHHVRHAEHRKAGHVALSDRPHDTHAAA